MNKTTRPVMRTPRKPKPTTSAVKKAHTAKPNARAVTLTIIANRPIWQLLSGAYHASSSRECEKTKPYNSQKRIYGMTHPGSLPRHGLGLVGLEAMPGRDVVHPVAVDVVSRDQVRRDGRKAEQKE